MNTLTMTTATANPQRQRARGCALAIGFLLCLTLHLPARGQYASDWFTVDGGGDASVGEGYAVEGTAGQADTGTLSGGGFTLAGGFWPGLTVPVTGGPTLFIQMAGNRVTISWSPAATGFVLEVTEDLAVPAWTPVTVSTGNPTTLAIGPKTCFFRLVSP